MALTDGQFEDLLRGEAPAPEDLNAADAARLAEMRAIRDRLAAAMATVRAGQELEERIREAVRAAQPSSGAAAPKARVVRFPRVVKGALAVAAAVLIIIALPFLVPETPTAQAELARIHTANLTGGVNRDNDPDTIIAHLTEKLGYAPVLPKLDANSSMVGCCVSSFRGRKVATYLLKIAKGDVSIVVTPDLPEMMKLKKTFERDGVRFHACCYDPTMCKMVAVRVGDRTYLAVGELAHEDLTAVLISIVRQRRQRPSS